ncbi:MAG: T9SS type A sorting domain-containing protein [Bacteroidetes bacterium]|nr:T9SS type A sorting domain-containing protein [Bacteroidota bacterium]
MLLSLIHRCRSANQLLLIGLFACLSVIIALPVGAQTIGDYRSRQGGTWSKTATWEKYTATGWVISTTTPVSTDGQITILSGHAVTANLDGSWDQIVIESGAELALTKTLTVIDGPGVDLEVLGTLLNNKTIRFTGGATANFKSGSNLIVNTNDIFQALDTSVITFETGSTASSNGNFSLANSAVVNLNAGVTFLNTSSITLADQSQLLVDGATLTNEGTISATGTSLIHFYNGGTYVHNRNGGTFPTASNTLWGIDSEAKITGVTTALPTGINDLFYNFTWDNAAQNAHLSLGGTPLGFQGDFTVVSTNTRSLTWNSVGTAMNIGGNFIQTGGDFRFQDSGSGVFTIDGDFTQTAGTTYLSTTSGAPVLNVDGDFTVSSSLINSSASSATINLAGDATQQIDADGTLSGAINMNLSGAGQKILASDLSVPGSLTETSGGLDLSGFGLTLTGNLSVATSMVNAGPVLFTGTGNKSIQIPASTEIADLSFDSLGGTLQLLSDISVSTVFTVVSGTLDLNGFNLVLAAGAVFYNTGVVSGPVTMTRAYSWNDDGWRMIASPVGGVNYSSLNTAFWTQGAAWATNSAGTANLQSFNFSTQDWSPVSGADGAIGAASAYILYAFKTNHLGNTVLPTSWTVTGNPHNTASIALSFSGLASTSYNYIGNPLTTNLDWDDTYFASTAVSSSYATWDPSVTTGGGVTGYKYYDALSGIGQAGRYIPPFTGLMTSATSASSNLVFTTSLAAARGAANYFGKRSEIAPHIRLLVQGQGLAEDETYLAFGSEATDETNAFDVERMTPLSASFATIWSVSRERKLAFDGRDMASGVETYDLVFSTTKSGIFEISAAQFSKIPSNWSLTLVDLVTGQTVSLAEGAKHQFYSTAREIVSLERPLSAIKSIRFRLMVSDSSIDTDPLQEDLALVDDVLLSQNYPNPFNPATSIRFSIPTSSPVRLEIYDTLGRRIKVLINNELSKGWHEVSWNANDLSSGTYFYRLSVGTQSITRSMLLLR